jgi:hypothetical protein
MRAARSAPSFASAGSGAAGADPAREVVPGAQRDEPDRAVGSLAASPQLTEEGVQRPVAADHHDGPAGSAVEEPLKIILGVAGDHFDGFASLFEDLDGGRDRFGSVRPASSLVTTSTRPTIRASALSAVHRSDGGDALRRATGRGCRRR